MERRVAERDGRLPWVCACVRDKSDLNHAPHARDLRAHITTAPSPSPSANAMYGFMDDFGNTISEVLPGRLWLTGLEGACDDNQLADLDISAVVSVLESRAEIAPFSSKRKRRFRGRPHIFLRAEDHEDEPLDRHFGHFLHIVASHPRTLVHCARGISRSATLAALAVWATSTALTGDQAIARVQRVRVIARPNNGFRRQLAAYTKAHA